MVDALNPEQEAAACHRGSHLLLVAGAGTGKTRTLVERMARLVEEGIPPDRLLAITFTNKAAGETQTQARTKQFVSEYNKQSTGYLENFLTCRS